MDVPAVVCSGGPMLAGSYGGEEVSLSKMFEAVGAYKAGMITDEQPVSYTHLTSTPASWAKMWMLTLPSWVTPPMC